MFKTFAQMFALGLCLAARLDGATTVNFDTFQNGMTIAPGNHPGDLLAADFGVTFATGDIPNDVSVGDVISFSNAVDGFRIGQSASAISPPNWAGALGTGTKDLLMSFDTPVSYVELTSDDAPEGLPNEIIRLLGLSPTGGSNQFRVVEIAEGFDNATAPPDNLLRIDNQSVSHALFQTTEEYEGLDNLTFQPLTQDFADLLNNKQFLTFRDTGWACDRPTYFENIYLSNYRSEVTANSPGLFTFLTKALIALFVELAGEELGGEIGHKIGEVFTKAPPGESPSSCSGVEGLVCDGFAVAGRTIGGKLASHVAETILAALNAASPFSPAVVHDAEILESIDVDGFGDIVPDIIQVASMPGNISHVQQMGNLDATISFIDKDLIHGVVVDEFDQPIPGTDLNGFLLEDVYGTVLFGVLVSNDINLSGRPLNTSDRVKMELDNVYPGIPDGTAADVVSTLLIANPQLEAALSELCDGTIYKWTQDGAGNWSDEGNWDEAFSAPDGTDAIAVFPSFSTVPLTVTTTENVTVGGLQFTGENAYIISGTGTIFLESDACCAGIGVTRGDHYITTQVTANQDVNVQIRQGGYLAFTNDVNLNGHTLTKGGDGRLSIIDRSFDGPDGTVELLSGTLSGRGIDADVHNDGGIVSPGIFPTYYAMRITGDYRQEDGGVLSMSLVNSDVYSSLQVDGVAYLGGMLTLPPTLAFTPHLGDTFEIITAGAVSGMFVSEQLPDLGELLVLELFYGADYVTLAVVPALTGDYNGNGIVDAADYTVWRDTLGTAGVGLPADGDGDKMVTQLDYGIWKDNFGATIDSGSSSHAAVPEPTTIILTQIGIAFHCRRRRRI